MDLDKYYSSLCHSPLWHKFLAERLNKSVSLLMCFCIIASVRKGRDLYTSGECEEWIDIDMSIIVSIIYINR